MVAELKLKKFDMRMVTDESVIVLLGKRFTGKSVLVKNLLSYHTDIPLGVVISPTETSNRYYQDFVPGMFIHDEYSPKIIDNVVRRQKAAVKAMQKEKETFGTSNMDPRGFLILDDCMYDSKWTKDTNMRFLFLNGRHIRVQLLITQQYIMGLPPTMRSNIDFTFILRENSLVNRRKIFDNYAAMFNSFELFCTVMDQCTNNFECLVINNRTMSNKLEDQVFWYKAPLTNTPFKLCSPQYWALDRQCSKKDNDETEELFDLEKLRKGARINVKVVKA
jgi:hypothetical protein